MRSAIRQIAAVLSKSLVRSGRLDIWNIACICAVVAVTRNQDAGSVSFLIVCLAKHLISLINKHFNRSKLLTDTSRLAHVEGEIRALNQAITFKNLGR